MDAKEILRNAVAKHPDGNKKGVDSITAAKIMYESALSAMEEYAQSLQDKVKELESALTESKAREERLRDDVDPLIELAFSESRLTHPIAGFKHDTFEDFKKHFDLI